MNAATFTMRNVSPDDEATWFTLYSTVRSDELGMRDWDPDLRARILRIQFEAQRRGYRDQFPSADERLILSDGQPIGWVIVDRTGASLHGIDIALVPDQRRKGIGTEIIRALHAEAAASGRAMVITVHRFNTLALALYRRLGFTAIGDTDVHTIMEWRA